MGNLNCASGGNADFEKANMLNNKGASRKGDPLQKLKESMTQFEEQLDRHNKEALERRQKVGTVFKELEGDESKHITSGTKQGLTDQHKFVELKEHFIGESKKATDSSQSLKESFTNVSSNFDKCLDIYEETIKQFGFMNKMEKKELLDDRNEEGGRKAKEAKLAGDCQQQSKTILAETEVQILFTQEGKTMHEIVKELEKELKQRTGSLVDFIQLHEKSKLDENKLLIIVCLVATRVGADASNAVENITSPENATLLLVHYTEPPAVSNKNSKLQLFAKEYKLFQEIFDMYFESENGFFPCDMNEKSLNGLGSFCKHGPYSQKL